MLKLSSAKIHLLAIIMSRSGRSYKTHKIIKEFGGSLHPQNQSALNSLILT